MGICRVFPWATLRILGSILVLTEAFVRVLRSENSVTDMWFEQLILKKGKFTSF